MLVNTPGQTPDHTSVWLPDDKVLLPGDVRMKPLLHNPPLPDREPANCATFSRSVDRLRFLGAEHLVPSASRPVSGKRRVFESLTIFRDALQFVSDQTARLAANGASATRAANDIRLTACMSEHEFVAENLDRVAVAWTARREMSRLTGWFGGAVEELHALTDDERAMKMAELARARTEGEDGAQGLLLSARDSLMRSRASDDDRRRADAQWALELSSHALRLVASDAARRQAALDAKEKSLLELARLSENQLAASYYATAARELRAAETSRSAPTVRRDNPLRRMSSRLRAEACDCRAPFSLRVDFSDLLRSHACVVRNCVLLVDARPPPATFDAEVRLSFAVWRSLLDGERDLMAAHMSGDVDVVGSVLDFKRFLALFDA